MAITTAGGKAKNRLRAILRHTPAVLCPDNSCGDAAQSWEKVRNYWDAAEDGLGGAAEEAEGVLRGHDVILKLRRSALEMPEAPGSIGISVSGDFVQHSRRLAAARSQLCAGTPQNHTKVSSAPSDTTGTSIPKGLPWFFCMHFLGTTIGTVVSSHLKLDFRSQVGFKTLIHFSSLRTDLLPCRLRMGLADLLWVPH